MLKILGGVFLILAGTDAAGKLWETKLLCYVAEGVQKLLLSREACVKLGILSKSFPTIGSAAEVESVVAEVSDGLNADQFELEPCAQVCGVRSEALHSVFSGRFSAKLAFWEIE